MVVSFPLCLLLLKKFGYKFFKSDRLQKILIKHKFHPLTGWENLSTSNRLEIYKAIKPIAGIYVIINLITGGMYVGSSALNSDGIVKKTWKVKILGKENSS